jgi:hypothetical protein
MLEAMPDLKDAIKVVTDPENLSAFGDSRTGLRAVNEHRAIAALRDQGAGKAEARTLAAEAVRELGGKVESRVQYGGAASGRDTRRVVETLYVPIGAIRG